MKTYKLLMSYFICFKENYNMSMIITSFGVLVGVLILYVGTYIYIYK